MISRRRWFATVMAVVGLAVPVGFPAVADAKPCGSIRANGKAWTVGGGGAKCHFMRKWSRRYIKHRKSPRGWKCHKRNGSGGCHKRGHRKRFFIFYPPD